MEIKHINLKEAENKVYLELIKIPHNYELLSSYMADLNIDTIFNRFKIDEVKYNKDELMLSILYKRFSDTILDYCIMAYRYIDKKIKLISWFKSHISKFGIDEKRVIIKYIKIILEDKNRFPFDGTFIVNAIDKINLDDKFEPIIVSEFEYFTDSKSIKYDLYMDSFIHINGLLKSKKEVIEDFFIKYDSADLIEKSIKYIPKDLNNSNNDFTKLPPPKKTKPINTPKILNESLDILFDRLKQKGIIECNKTDYNKLFNGSNIESIRIKWLGSIGLLKELFNQLHSKYKYEDKFYYKDILQFTNEQYKNNKVSTKDKTTATLLLQ